MGEKPKYQLPRVWMNGQLYGDEVKGQVKTCMGELIAASVIARGSPIFLHKEDWQTDKEIHAKQLWRAPILCLQMQQRNTQMGWPSEWAHAEAHKPLKHPSESMQMSMVQKCKQPEMGATWLFKKGVT